MKILLGIILALFASSAQASDTLYACLDGDGKVTEGWDQPHGDCTTEMTKSDPRWVDYRKPRVPTQGQKDAAFDAQILSHDVLGPLVRALAKREGLTAQEMLDLVKAER